MADNNPTSPPPAALESSVPTAPPQPRVRLAANAGDEDIDALIDDLESKDDHHLEEEEGQQSYSAVPEELLQTDTRTGLTEAEVVARRREYCPGELEERENLILKFLLCFVQQKMLVSAGIAAYLQEWVDLGVICAVLLLNATVDLVQGHQAASIVSELKGTLALKTFVRRDGILQKIVFSDLVPGDIIHLEPETIIPADGRVVVADTELLVDQSSITGDSLAVRKEEGDTCFQATTVLRGETFIVATATGQNTFVSRAAALVPRHYAGRPVAPYVRVLNSIGSTHLVLLILTLCVVWVSSYYRSTDITTILRFSLSITIIGVPVGFPAVVTTILAVGAADLAMGKVIVQRLKAIECLAGVEVLCSDKTGTLTQNKLNLAKPFTVNGVDPNDLMLTACLTTSRKRHGMDTIDKALLKTLYLYPAVKSALIKYRFLDYQPFDPYYKKTQSTVISPQGERITCVKGAPLAILNLVAAHHSIPKEIEEAYKDKVAKLANQGFRALGVCRRRDENAWELLGLMPCLDPLRHDTHRHVKEAENLGLAIKMISGDAVGIVRATSRQLGLGTNVYNARRLGLGGDGDGDMSGSDAYDFIEDADGFAEVFPSQKYSIVEILQQRGYLVAVTGDGANDGPSLKKADLGLAVEGASDAARAAADVVFLDPGLGAIILAIKVSRQVFRRIYAYAVYRIALVLHMVIFLGLWIVILNRTLNLNLVVFVAIFADVTTLAIAYDYVPYSPTPYRWNVPKLWGTSILLGVILAAGTWITLTTMLVGGEDGGIVQNYGNIDTVLFLQICLTESWLIFITRANGPFWYYTPSWRLVGAVVFVNVFATLFCLFGWFEDGHTHIVAVIRVWIFSFGVFCAMAGFYYFAEGSAAFNNIMHGKSARRSSKQRSLEDFVVSLRRVSTRHEKSQ